MEESQIWVQITTLPTNLAFQTVVSLNGDKWDVAITGNAVRATSRRTYLLPDTGFDERDRAIRDTMNQIVGHLRNLGCFALDLDMRWDYEGGYSGTHILESGMPFPSIHQSGMSTTYSDAIVERGQRIIDDVKSGRKRGLKSMLNYWRRACELDNLGFDSEAFLNYFKVFECMAELNTNDVAKRAILNRFCPGGKPQTTLCKRFGAKTKAEQDNLCRQIKFLAKALAAAGISEKLSRGLFVTALSFVYMRHGWNVAHKLVRSNPYDQYRAIGQHSDEFSLVMIENLYISKISKLMILLYVRPGRYELHSVGGSPMVVPTKGRGSIKHGK